MAKREREKERTGELEREREREKERKRDETFIAQGKRCNQIKEMQVKGCDTGGRKKTRRKVQVKERRMRADFQ